MIEKILHQEQLIALIIRHNFSEPGISFFTPDDYSQQLAYMQHPKGKEIAPHVHNPQPRQITYTQEVLCIKSGKLRVDFYAMNKDYLESRILNTGDVILLATGGHGFEVLEDLEMIEIKQGPYTGLEDKTRFEPVAKQALVIK